MYRFSVSPFEELRLDSLKLALLNYHGAKKSNDKFLVRFEDIARDKESKDSEILGILALCGIKYDYLYYQSENFKYHLQFASSLMDKGKAYACFCESDKCTQNCMNISQEELLNNNLPFTIRLKSKDEDFLIMTQEKYPTRVFATACDDMLQGLSHIIESEDNKKNEKQEEEIRTSLGFLEKIDYVHIPALEDISVKQLLNDGLLPEAIVEYLQNLQDNTFDIDSLQEYNQKHINLLDDMELSKVLGYSSHDIGKLAKLFSSKYHTTAELKTIIDDVFAQKNSEKYKESLAKLKAIVKDAPYFEKYEEFKAHLEDKSKIANDEFTKVLSILLTNQESGPNLKDLYTHIKHYLGEITR
ncbi:MAG TPA: glutamate--tRNA ligase [Sulfurospirillum sp. UBA11407]|nr:MAG TPA: glutamate--tRNA ligase [Sulfurospirillum sp. UBA11407]